MADSSLDDFFAKKDKSKKKSKSKLTPSDILAKQEDGSDTRKKDKKKKEKEKQSTTTNSEEPKTTEDEEWVDFEQETEKDYSGLRIQNIQISKEQEVQEEENDNDESDEGENSDKKDKTAGPWNTPSQSQSQQVSTPLITQQAPPPEEKAPSQPPADQPSEPSKPTKYVPPAVRAAAAAAASSGASPGEPSRATQLRRKKVAPNLQSEDDFPTLGGGAAGPSSNFERVQTGGRQMEDPTKGNLQLSLGNKYAALQD
ncbi:hypothetical protein KUTeg_015246 [Tegillarca granosa]|uniref:CDV3 homolog n=1 Tax=Tegillarca granosa TaxID=220873 RepID=A0ABQ9EPK6_TEGGR|nr:hypothetical protein KUTeg_015246 [Tegillarca granosa]